MPRAEFTGRWGFTTPSGIAKPIHRAFELLHHAGTSQVHATAASGNNCSGVSMLAVANGTSRAAGMMLFVSNEGGAPCTVTVGLTEVWHVSTTQVVVHLIDKEHGNPYGVWQQLGSPPFPTPVQAAQLRQASQINSETMELSDQTAITLTVKAPGLAVIAI